MRSRLARAAATASSSAATAKRNTPKNKTNKVVRAEPRRLKCVKRVSAGITARITASLLHVNQGLTPDAIFRSSIFHLPTWSRARGLQPAKRNVSFGSALLFLVMSIRILVTGGTFDKEYNERNGQLFFKDTHIAEML